MHSLIAIAAQLAGTAEAVRLDVITSGTADVTGAEALRPGAAASLAAVKVIPLEQPNVRCRLIDIAPAPHGTHARRLLIEQLAGELSSQSREVVTAFRGAHRWTPRYERVRLPEPVERLRRGGVYLITGGLGGAGLTIAHELAASFAAKLVLVSRSTRNADEARRSLEDAGAEVLICAADVSDVAAVERVVRETHERFGRIHGVIHAAGVVDFAGVIAKRTRAQTDEVLAVKVEGTRILERLLGEEIELFVLFSTLGSILYHSKFGQVGYAAANEVLDLYAPAIRARGGPFTIAINWDDWAGAGMSEQAARRRGLGGVDPSTALTAADGAAAFRRAVQSPYARLAVSVRPLDELIRDDGGGDGRVSRGDETGSARAAVRQLVREVVHALRGGAGRDLAPLPGRRNHRRRRRFLRPRRALVAGHTGPGRSAAALRRGTADGHDLRRLHRARAGGAHRPFPPWRSDAGARTVRPLAELLQELDARGITLAADGEKLRVRAASDVAASLRAELTARKHELLHYLTLRDGPIDVAPRGTPAPLSLYQRRLWLTETLTGASSAFNMQIGWTIDGPLDVAALEWAVGEVLARHDILRSTIEEDADGQPHSGEHVRASRKHTKAVAAATALHTEVDTLVANGRPHFGVRRPQLPLSYVRASREQTDIDTLVAEEIAAPFDLRAQPPVRARLIQVGERRFVFLFTIHHIAADPQSVGILARELSQLYATRVALPAPRMQYGDFARWQRRLFESGLLEERLAFWRRQLEGARSDLDLPLDRRRGTGAERRGGTVAFAIDGRLAGALRTIGQRHGATPFMTLLAAYATLLARMARQSELTIGCPYGNRERDELREVVGFFVSTLVLRIDLGGDPTFAELLQRVRATCLAAFAHDVPFDSLVEALQPERTPGLAPFFQAMFVLQTADVSPLRFEGASVTPLPARAQNVEHDLNLTMRAEGDGLTGLIEYDADLFDAATIEQLARSFVSILEHASSEPACPVSRLRLLAECDRQRIVERWNDTGVEGTASVSVDEWVSIRVTAEPDATAIESEAGSLTYRQLDDAANGVAAMLRARGAGPDAPVGVAIPRSPELIVALLGVLKSGAAFVVLDPAQPETRREAIVRAAAIEIVLDRESVQHAAAASPRLRPHHPAQLAYICFTSGSTGTPKGVMVEHGSLANFSLAVMRAYELAPGDRVLQFAAPDFDVFQEELWPTLMAGATLVLSPAKRSDSLEAFQRFVEQRHLSVLNLPAAMWHAWVWWMVEHGRRPPATLRLLVTGSDRVSPERFAQWQRIAPGIAWINAYGPTEATIGTTLDRRAGSEETATRDAISDAAPIGRPIANAAVYIVDELLQPLPRGAIGEICIGGAGVARGYIGEPGRSARTFVADPFARTPGARMLRTGDLGRFLPDGTIEILGRIDAQVKVRGFRIEPGEIAAALDRCPGVIESAVVPIGSRLAAFVATTDASLNAVRLKRWAQEQLPSWMVPSAFVLLERLPISSSGKVDRHALASMTIPEPASEEIASPRSRAEELLARVWSDVLGRPRVGIFDNFFDLGGDSILALQAVARARQHGLSITARGIFEGQTVARVAEQAADAGVREDREPVTGEVTLAPIQRWFFAHVREDAHHYNQAVMLAAPPHVEVDALRAALDALLVHHDMLRCRFSAGRATIVAPGGRVPLEICAPSEAATAIQAAHTGFDLERGPLFRAQLIEESAPRLLLVAHHLVVDAVSWGRAARRSGDRVRTGFARRTDSAARQDDFVSSLVGARARSANADPHRRRGAAADRAGNGRGRRVARGRGASRSRRRCRSLAYGRLVHRRRAAAHPHRRERPAAQRTRGRRHGRVPGQLPRQAHHRRAAVRLRRCRLRRDAKCAHRAESRGRAERDRGRRKVACRLEGRERRTAPRFLRGAGHAGRRSRRRHVVAHADAGGNPLPFAGRRRSDGLFRSALAHAHRRARSARVARGVGAGGRTARGTAHVVRMAKRRRATTARPRTRAAPLARGRLARARRNRAGAVVVATAARRSRFSASPSIALRSCACCSRAPATSATSFSGARTISSSTAGRLRSCYARSTRSTPSGPAVPPHRCRNRPPSPATCAGCRRRIARRRWRSGAASWPASPSRPHST